MNIIKLCQINKISKIINKQNLIIIYILVCIFCQFIYNYNINKKLSQIKKIQKEIDKYIDKPKFILCKKKFIADKNFTNFVNLLDIFGEITKIIIKNMNLNNAKFSMQDENANTIFQNSFINNNGIVINDWKFISNDDKKILFDNYKEGKNLKLLNKQMLKLIKNKLITKSKEWDEIHIGNNDFFCVRYTPQTFSSTFNF